MIRVCRLSAVFCLIGCATLPPPGMARDSGVPDSHRYAGPANPANDGYRQMEGYGYGTHYSQNQPGELARQQHESNRLSPDERRALREQINDAAREIYPHRH